MKFELEFSGGENVFFFSYYPQHTKIEMKEFVSGPGPRFFVLDPKSGRIDLGRARSHLSFHRCDKISDLKREVIPECSGIPV